MNINELPAVGSPLEGGFYAGLFQIGADKFALIVAPKAEGHREDIAWGKAGTKIEAKSPIDGLANTNVMAAQDYEIAKWACGLSIGGHSDWYLPSRDELEICYRNLKPTTDENYCGYRDGENSHSIPPTEIYEEETPAQTAIELFQDGNAEAFDARWYWSSTQHSSDYAYVQTFEDGYQYGARKVYTDRARAVRRLLVIE